MGCLCPKKTVQKQPNQQQNTRDNIKQSRETPIRPPKSQSQLIQLPQQKIQKKTTEQRRYLPKDQLKWPQMMIMIASSARKQRPDKYFQERNMSLQGVNYDIDLFKEIFRGYITDCIQSSQDEGTLLSKTFIVNMLQKLFKKPALDFYLFYSGHGYNNPNNPSRRGSIIIERQKNRPINWGDPKQTQQYTIDFQQIITIWNRNKLCLESNLYIFMDSCYSGQWCNKLIKMGEGKVCVYASCSPEQLSRGYKGGLFFKTIFQKKQHFEQNYNLLIDTQTPVFVDNSKTISKLNKHHLQKLQQNIKNCNNLNSLSKIKDTQLSQPNKIDLNKTLPNISEKKQKIRKSPGKITKDNKRILENDVDIYEGELRDGKKQGRGTYRYSFGDIYDGEWKNNKKQGKGVYQYAYGGKYEGYFVNDKKQGKGIFYYMSGAKFQGQWKNDGRQGKGVYTYADGRKIEETWKNNIKIS